VPINYPNAVSQLLQLGHELASHQKFDLEHMRRLAGALGNPQRRLASVLIAGTNGKGSTAATLASIFEASNLKTGLYTSPHLISINERIRIDGQPIADPDFTRVHDEVEEVAGRLVENGELPWHPSFFEMLTAMAFEHFARVRPDIVVLEVGMGGRLDATNVVEPRVSVITDIALDHQKYLGTTVGEIAREKVGIIRPGGAVVTLPQSPEANAVIGNTILDLGARAVSAVEYVPPVSPRSSSCFTAESAECAEEKTGEPRSRYPLHVLGREIMVESPLIGRHQLRNIALAIAAAEELQDQGFRQITPDSIERGVRATRWPGRFQVLPARGREPEYVFDVAHNPAGAWALRSTLSAVCGDRPITMVFGVMRDKAVAEIAEILFPIAEHVIATHADNPRSATPDEIRQAASRVATDIQEADNVAFALEKARRTAGPGGLAVVTGSIYIVGEAMRSLDVRI
jgi:dihydrofolate synthase / folylpolyglutamate synthase